MPLSKTIIDQTLATPLGEGAYKIVETLMDAGYDAWWVGGSVRDMLLDTVPTEIDIGTDALPDRICELFPKHDAKGGQFGSIIVKRKEGEYEVTTFREDDEASDGRHPESVTFGKREEDAKRRDLTINALYFHPVSSELYDPFSGEGDLDERLIRIIGEPATRIKHDALRLLRVVRFRARIEGQYEPTTYQALRELAHVSETLSGQRILEELEKILSAKHADRALEDLWELGILSHILPELHACKGIPQPIEYHQEGDVWEHTLAVTRAYRPEHGADLRLAALFHDCGKAKSFSLKDRIRFDDHASISADLTKEALDRLQCTSKRKEKICWLIRHHMMMGSFFEMPMERKGHWYYHPWFNELLELFLLDIGGTTPKDYSLYNKILADYHAYLDSRPLPPKPLLTGVEVMDILGIEPGERVGEILAALHQAQMQKKMTSKGEAKQWVNEQR